MNYKLHYDKLIHKAQNRSILKSEYKEVHHIIPKCIGGSDDKSNLVALFPEEHLIAHLLLIKIYPENDKLVYAANMMTNGSNNKKQQRKISNKKYKFVRMKHANLFSKYNPMFQDKNKKLFSDRMKEFNKTYVATDETNTKISNTVKLGWENNSIRKQEHTNRFLGSNNPRFDNTFYEFIHENNTIIICYQSVLSKEFGCDGVYNLINGKRKSSKGWKFTGRKFQRLEIQ